MLVQEVIDFLESWSPISSQESYDNCGLIIEVVKELILF